MSDITSWRRCSACKTPIALGAIHQVCSVSTCNRPRTGLVFCSVSCWEVHLPDANHREAWAVERRAPTTLEPAAESAPAAPTATLTATLQSGGNALRVGAVHRHACRQRTQAAQHHPGREWRSIQPNQFARLARIVQLGVSDPGPCS